MFAVIVPLILFVSDVQISTMSVYPDSIATVIAGHIGSETVYDCGDLVEHGSPFEAFI